MRNEGNAFQRDTYWDVVKALLIFLVIFGHVIQFFVYQGENKSGFWSDPLFKGIYLFHMPLFMLVSGYFAAKSVANRSWHVIPRYLQRLAYPCIGMGIIFLINAILKHNNLLSSFYGGGIILWFLIVVFECLLCYLIMQLKESWWWRLVTFILPIPAAILISRIPVVSLVWPHSYHFTYLWPIFVLGSYLAKHRFAQHHISWKWSVFFILYVVLFYFFKPTWYVYRLPLSANLSSVLVDGFRTIAAIAGCGTFLWVAKYIYQAIGKYAIVKNVGQATLALYVLQTFFFLKSSLICSFLPEKLNYIHAIVISCGILVVLYLIYGATRKIPIIATLLYGEKPFSNK